MKWWTDEGWILIVWFVIAGCYSPIVESHPILFQGGVWMAAYICMTYAQKRRKDRLDREERIRELQAHVMREKLRAQYEKHA